jgi:hypothetical protein
MVSHSARDADGRQDTLAPPPPVGGRHRVLMVKAVGRTPEAVADETQRLLSDAEIDGWMLVAVQSVVYNAATTGYLLLVMER